METTTILITIAVIAMLSFGVYKFTKKVKSNSSAKKGSGTSGGYSEREDNPKSLSDVEKHERR